MIEKTHQSRLPPHDLEQTELHPQLAHFLPRDDIRRLVLGKVFQSRQRRVLKGLASVRVGGRGGCLRSRNNVLCDFEDDGLTACWWEVQEKQR